jgi:hypothetical protein
MPRCIDSEVRGKAADRGLAVVHRGPKASRKVAGRSLDAKKHRIKVVPQVALDVETHNIASRDHTQYRVNFAGTIETAPRCIDPEVRGKVADRGIAVVHRGPKASRKVVDRSIDAKKYRIKVVPQVALDVETHNVARLDHTQRIFTSPAPLGRRPVVSIQKFVGKTRTLALLPCIVDQKRVVKLLAAVSMQKSIVSKSFLKLFSMF